MATIFCFTSTGNSLYAAKKIAEEMDGKVLSMNLGRLDCDDDIIGLVFPVYFWGLPRMVRRFISEMELTNKGAYVFAVVTCGGPTFGVLRLVKRLLQSKDMRLQYGAKIHSVSSYLPEYNAKDSERFRQKIDQKIMDIAKNVKCLKTNRISAFPFPNRMIHKSYPDESGDRYFTVAPTCTGCATCQRVCPSANISLEIGTPAFKHQCEHCLACLHHCPVQAIDWKEKTKGKARFRNVGVSLNELIAFNNTGIFLS